MPRMLSDRVIAWRDAGTFEEVAGRRLFVTRRDGDGPLLLLLHGFPSSSYDWRQLLDLMPGCAALAFDCLGFGLSDKPAGFTYTLGWQADAAEELVRRAGSPPVFVVAHDMGTSVATELFARELAGEASLDIQGALLFNGSILLHRASPTIGQKLLRSRLGPFFTRLNTERTFTAQFGRIFSKEHPLTREEAADQWALLAHNNGHRRLPDTINYMNERERLTDRWHGAIRDWPGALSLAWGLEDPVATTAVLAGLRELRPHAPVTELPGLGHYPQLEAPNEVAAALVSARALPAS
jgi:pimeloyl-ACP methyl ester carboxylesterase